jgi:hypothetical protein
MARKSTRGGVNKSEAIRAVFMNTPDIKVRDLIEHLASQGIEVQSNLVYLIKGKLKGEKGRRGRPRKDAALAAVSGNSDALSTIMKVKKLAVDVGGLRALKALVDALSE